MERICITLIIGLFLNVLLVNAQFVQSREERSLSIVSRQAATIYRKPNKEEEVLLVPDAEDRMKFSAFLDQPNTGLIKLISDLGCGDNPKILVVTDLCMQYTMPGGGSAYSFRKETYRIWRLADLLYKDGIIHAIGARSQGILVGLGEMPLEKVSINTEGVEFLRDFVPETEFEAARKQNSNLIEGVAINGFYYRKALRSVENYTYVLRTVAYRGRFYRSVGGVVYNEFDFDKRRDVIVAFQIVRQDKKDGSITLLWKELWDKKAPKLRTDKKDSTKDF